MMSQAISVNHYNNINNSNTKLDNTMTNSNGSSSSSKRLECTEFIDSVNFLIYLKDPSKLINNCTSETLNCLNKINAFNFKHSNASFDLLPYDTQKRFIQILSDYFQYIYEYLKENSSCSPRSLEPRRFDILYKFSLILWSWTDRSVEFCLRLHDYHFIRVIFKVADVLIDFNDVNNYLESIFKKYLERL